MNGQMLFHLNALNGYIMCEDCSMTLIHVDCGSEILESHEKAYIEFPHEINFENPPPFVQRVGKGEISYQFQCVYVDAP